MDEALSKSEAFIAKGNLLRKQGKSKQATSVYVDAIKSDLNNYLAFYNLGLCLSKQKRFDEAASFYYYDYAIALNSEFSQSYYALGEVFFNQHKLDKAIASYPQFARTYNNLVRQEPSFIIIGAGKCGTTSLYQYLSQHPQIVPPINKEIDFFNFNFEQGKDWYLAHFPNLPQNQFITGEASPSYFSYPHVDRRIDELFPQVKLIVLLRNPVERTISHYYHRIREGSEKRSLEAALNSELKSIAQATTEQLSYLRGYLGIGMYFYKLERWLSVFPRDRVLILKSEDFYQKTPEIMQPRLAIALLTSNRLILLLAHSYIIDSRSLTSSDKW